MRVGNLALKKQYFRLLAADLTRKKSRHSRNSKSSFSCACLPQITRSRFDEINNACVRFSWPCAVEMKE